MMVDIDGEYGVNYELSDYNAHRACAICRESATRYLFREGDLSTFRCDEHIPPAEGDG